uniref:Putative structural protein n=1 Tax=viral metagenome TaxID=1070528 RepID=A0A6M3IV08_9ZZZZ
MDNLKGNLKAVLLRHEGPERAITAKTLAHMFGYKDDRAIRLAIRDLIAEGLPVASSTENTPGYFIVTDRKQAEQYALSIRSRLIEDAIRRRDFRRAADQWLTPAVQQKLI